MKVSVPEVIQDIISDIQVYRQLREEVVAEYNKPMLKPEDPLDTKRRSVLKSWLDASMELLIYGPTLLERTESFPKYRREHGAASQATWERYTELMGFVENVIASLAGIVRYTRELAKLGVIFSVDIPQNACQIAESHYMGEALYKVLRGPETKIPDEIYLSVSPFHSFSKIPREKIARWCLNGGCSDMDAIQSWIKLSSELVEEILVERPEYIHIAKLSVKLDEVSTLVEKLTEQASVMKFFQTPVEDARLTPGQCRAFDEFHQKMRHTVSDDLYVSFYERFFGIIQEIRLTLRHPCRNPDIERAKTYRIAREWAAMLNATH